MLCSINILPRDGALIKHLIKHLQLTTSIISLQKVCFATLQLCTHKVWDSSRLLSGVDIEPLLFLQFRFLQGRPFPLSRELVFCDCPPISLPNMSFSSSVYGTPPAFQRPAITGVSGGTGGAFMPPPPGASAGGEPGHYAPSHWRFVHFPFPWSIN